MNHQELIEKIKEQCQSGKVSCTEARKLAVDLDVELSKMGGLCDEAGIKIYGCELGCF